MRRQLVLTPPLLLCVGQYLLSHHGQTLLEVIKFNNDVFDFEGLQTLFRTHAPSLVCEILYELPSTHGDLVAVLSECALCLLVLSFCVVHMFSTLFEAGLTAAKRRDRDSWKQRHPSLSVVTKGAKLVFHVLATTVVGYVFFVGIRSSLHARVLSKRYAVS